MKTVQEKITIMQAFVDGKQVECCQATIEKNWTRVFTPSWNWEVYDYRIKENMEQKALELYAETLGIPKHIFLPLETTKHGWRAVIDAVKRGDIT